jgi:hypothetical protein
MRKEKDSFFQKPNSMSSAGTLLSDLDNRAPNGDGDSDLVQKILADINGNSGGNPVQMPGRGMSAPPPPLPANQGTPALQGTTTYAQAADPRIPQAHMIGNEHPSPADFAAAMVGMNRPSDAALYQGQQFQGGNSGAPSEYPFDSPKKNFYAKVIDEAKTPILVALIFFVLSLPAINMLFAHYLPSLVLPTGSLTTLGLAAKSAIGGALFWILQRVVAPLLQ